MKLPKKDRKELIRYAEALGNFSNTVSNQKHNITVILTGSFPPREVELLFQRVERQDKVAGQQLKENYKRLVDASIAFDDKVRTCLVTDSLMWKLALDIGKVKYEANQLATLMTEISAELSATGKAGDEIKTTPDTEWKKGICKKKGMITMETSKENWGKIKSEYECGKMELAKKINFVKDDFKRKIIFRDVEHAFVLVSHGFAKPAVILAGGVIEELLKEYLKHKKIKPKNDTFSEYIKACEDNRLLKRGVSRLSDAIRDFRNLVHISEEESKRHTISMATAKGAVSSIFSIANDFH